VLEDKERKVRQEAAGALGEIGPGASDAVPVLVKALDDENANVRQSAAYVLGQIGPSASEAVPKLIEALETEEVAMRSVVARALGRIKPLTILIADNDPISCRSLIKILENHHSDIVEDGIAAVSAVRDNEYDLVLMEKSMPRMSGLEAARHIRAMKGAKSSIPIIAVTASALKGDDEQCFQAGMNDYLTKPVDSGSLLERVAKWGGVMSLDRHRPTRAPPLPPIQREFKSSDHPLGVRPRSDS
jgi:CheY-like chemotaxis protein